MLLGEYFHSLDDKGRVVLPSSFRRRFENGVVVAKGKDTQLMVYPPDVFEQEAQKILAKPPSRETRREARTLFGGADHQMVDKTGRLLVKQDLREFAGLETGTEVVVIGSYDHVELWRKDHRAADRVAGDESFVNEED